MNQRVDVNELKTVDQFIHGARELLDPGPYHWAAVGAGEGVTVARNRVALDHLALLPRMMNDVSEVDTSTEVLGIPVSMPILVSPVGSTVLYHPDSAVASAQGATKAGTIGFCATLTRARWEDAAATAPGRHLFQLYVGGDRGWLAEVADRVEAAQFAGICVTVDSTVPSRRDGLIAANFDWRVEREGIPPNLAQHGRDDSYKCRFTWSELEYLIGRTRLPVLLKGIMRGSDAQRALDCGVRGIYVSNHGGRSVDHALSTIEALPEVVSAVNGRCDVIIDGGFTHGADVIKALALGADAVAIGRLQCWALALGGAEGLARLLDILHAELSSTMALMGLRGIGEITEDCVRWSYPTPGVRAVA
jgi:isopentenyl diphosphate isomerase/L-lactate dehydrogenase-like FMN-dependent dehydrogenase